MYLQVFRKKKTKHDPHRAQRPPNLNDDPYTQTLPILGGNPPLVLATLLPMKRTMRKPKLPRTTSLHIVGSYALSASVSSTRIYSVLMQQPATLGLSQLTTTIPCRSSSSDLHRACVIPDDRTYPTSTRSSVLWCCSQVFAVPLGSANLLLPSRTTLQHVGISLYDEPYASVVRFADDPTL